MFSTLRRCLAVAAPLAVVASCSPASRVVEFPSAHVCAAREPVHGAVDVTFLAQSDTHFGSELAAAWLGPGNRLSAAMTEMDRIHRQIAEQANTIEGRTWPPELGGQVGKPLGMVIAGDLTENGMLSEWASFERVYGRVPGSGALHMPVAESIGNHDSHGGDAVGEQVTRRHGAVAYSLDWGGLHLVSLGEEPTDDSVGWLRRDLDCVGSAAPVVLFFHKPVAGPFSARGFLASSSNAQLFIDAIDGHDVVAIFHGHIHRTGPYEWRGIPVYVMGSAKTEARSFLVVRVTDDRLQVAAWNYEFGAFWWWEQRPRHPTDRAPRILGKRAFGSREPLVPYPDDPTAVW